MVPNRFAKQSAHPLKNVGDSHRLCLNCCFLSPCDFYFRSFESLGAPALPWLGRVQITSAIWKCDFEPSCRNLSENLAVRDPRFQIASVLQDHRFLEHDTPKEVWNLWWQGNHLSILFLASEKHAWEIFWQNESEKRVIDVGCGLSVTLKSKPTRNPELLGTGVCKEK